MKANKAGTIFILIVFGLCLLLLFSGLKSQNWISSMIGFGGIIWLVGAINYGNAIERIEKIEIEKIENERSRQEAEIDSKD